LAPVIAATTLRALDLIDESDELRAGLAANAALFRQGMSAAGFNLSGAGHPIIPVMLGDARLATAMAARLLDEGLYVIGFSFPVVPQGQARIRTQMSAAHTTADIEFAVDAFTRVGRELEVVS
jgi:glycine C-acetyltransferase